MSINQWQSADFQMFLASKRNYGDTRFNVTASARLIDPSLFLATLTYLLSPSF